MLSLTLRAQVPLALGFLLLGGCSLDWSKRAPEQGRVDSGVDAGSDPQVPTPPEPKPDAGDAPEPDASTPDPTPPECDDNHPCATDFECMDERCVFVPPPRLPSAWSQTSGGGTVSSSGRTLRLTVGSPQPFGAASSENYRLRLGPKVGNR